MIEFRKNGIPTGVQPFDLRFAFGPGDRYVATVDVTGLDSDETIRAAQLYVDDGAGLPDTTPVADVVALLAADLDATGGTIGAKSGSTQRCSFVLSPTACTAMLTERPVVLRIATQKGSASPAEYTITSGVAQALETHTRRALRDSVPASGPLSYVTVVRAPADATVAEDDGRTFTLTLRAFNAADQELAGGTRTVESDEPLAADVGAPTGHVYPVQLNGPGTPVFTGTVVLDGVTRSATNGLTVVPVAGTPARLLYDLAAIGYDTSKLRMYTAGTGTADAFGRSGVPALTTPNGAVPVVGSGAAGYWDFDGTGKYLTTGHDADFDLSAVDGVLFVAGKIVADDVVTIQNDTYTDGGVFLESGSGPFPVRRFGTSLTFDSGPTTVDTTTTRLHVMHNWRDTFWAQSVSPAAPYLLAQAQFHIAPFSSAHGAFALNIGRRPAGTAAQGQIKCVAWGRDLTRVGVELVQAYIAANHTYTPATAPLREVVFLGDSITHGYGESDAAHMWRNLVMTDPALSGFVNQDQAAVQRQIVSLQADLRAIHATLPVPCTQPVVYTLMMGTNDIVVYLPQPTGAELAASTIAIISAILAASPWTRVVYIPLLDAYAPGYPNYETITSTAEATVRAWIAADSDRTARCRVPAANTGPWVLGSMNPSAGTVRSTDGIHPNDLASSEIAAAVKPLVLALVVP